MSNVADYYSPDETPIERDPTPEEMIPSERDFLNYVQNRAREIAFAADCLFREIGERIDLLQSVPLPCDDVDADFTDPFADL